MIDIRHVENRMSRHVISRFRQWEKFLDEEVTFGPMGNGIHGKSHCARVLLLALMISDGMDVDEDWMNALCISAVMHDSRRLDDMYDTGHGKRAAEYYRELASRKNMTFDNRAYLAMMYHDLDDSIGEKAIMKSDGIETNALLLFRVLKDADALDRFRLGPGGLDERFLRTPEAKRLIGFSRDLYEGCKHRCHIRV